MSQSVRSIAWSVTGYVGRLMQRYKVYREIEAARERGKVGRRKTEGGKGGGKGVLSFPCRCASNRNAPEETVPVNHAAFKTGCATRTCSH